MECRISIILNKDIKEDYGMLLPNPSETNTVNVGIYTNGLKPIDYRAINYNTLLDEDLCKDFIKYFSYGRKIEKCAKSIYVENIKTVEKNTIEQNNELLDLIKLNKLTDKKLYINVGNISLNKEDIDSIKMFEECSYGLIAFDDSGIFHSVDKLIILNDLINETVDRTNKHNFSPLEKALYSYDLIKTDFMYNPETEEKFNSLVECYPEPSYCYSLIYKEVLARLGIKNYFTSGSFYKSEVRAMNVALIKDEEYDINGVFYFDLASNSKQRIQNSLVGFKEEDINEELVNNYSGFCKSKDYMIFKSNLDSDFLFGVFGKEFMELYDDTYNRFGINGIFQLKDVLNNVGYFIDGRTVIDAYHGIKNDAELEEIREKAERYTSLFDNEITGEDFLELLFNVRKVEYMENKDMFKLSTETLKKCVFKSKFTFLGMNLDLDPATEYELEDIDEAKAESFDIHFDEVASQTDIDERIRKLKLSLFNKNHNQNDDNK